MKTIISFLISILFSLSIFAQGLPVTDSTSDIIPVKVDTVHYVITAQQLASDTAMVSAVAQILTKLLPPQYVWIIAALVVLIIGFLVILSHMDVKLFKKSAVILLLLCAGTLVNAQVISNERMTKYYQKHPAKALLLGGTSTTATTTGHILSLEPSFGLNALTIQKGLNGWESSGIVAPSFTYGLSFGEYTSNVNNMTVANYLTLGAGIAAGVIPQSVLSGSFQTYGFVTIYNYATLGAGYDAVTKKPFFGLAASVPLFTFKQGLGSYILKLF